MTDATDIDRLLTEHFQREMPSPWPELHPPGLATPLVRTPARSHSRYALVASLAGLAVIAFLIAANMPRMGKSIYRPKVEDGNADVPAHLQPK